VQYSSPMIPFSPSRITFGKAYTDALTATIKQRRNFIFKERKILSKVLRLFPKTSK